MSDRLELMPKPGMTFPMKLFFTSQSSLQKPKKPALNLEIVDD